MADMATSVLARLKNKAAESDRSYQLCLQLFCQEEFFASLGKIKICRKPCDERWSVPLFPYQL